MDRDDDQVVSPTIEQEDVTESAATSTASDDNPDSSPEATEPEESFGDAISRAMEGEDSDPDAQEEAPKDAEEGDQEDGEKAPDSKDLQDGEADKEAEEKEDDGADLKEGQRVPYDRFKKVIQQRNEYREREQELSSERDEYRTGHEQYQAIQGFMQQNDLRPQDVAEALTIAAQFNSDPAGALETLKAKMSGLQEFTGERLPGDLQERVDTGEIDQRDAQEIVRQRNENAMLRRRQQETEQRQQEEVQQRTVQQVQQSMAQSANDVQKELADRDPDFDRKYPWIEKELKLLIQQERPANAEQAAKLVRQAHQTVSRDLEKMIPRRNVRPGPSSQSAGGASSSTPEPASMQEAIERAMNQTTE